jgi:16S rRNA (guanine1207-N2)-methyltransferase
MPLPGLALDVIVMNPPFHQGRAASPQLGAAFIAAAAQMLKPSGQLWMVANRHLPYEPALAAAFKTHSELPGTPGFKLFHAEGPLRGPAAASPARTRTRMPRKTGRRS